MPHRGELSDEQWEKLEPLLPPQKPLHGGRPAKSHRKMINGMLWICRTGAPWRDLPPRYGKVQSVFSRFRRWKEQGLWQQVFATLQSIAEAEGRIDWESFTSWTPPSSGLTSTPLAQKGGPLKRRRSGGARAAFPPRFTCAPRAEGKPLVFVLTPGQCGEAPQLERLMEAGVVSRVISPGRPRLRPRALAGGKACTGVATRAFLRRRRVRAVVPRRRNELSDGRHRFDRAAYRKRNRINRLKQFRRVATRYEKRAANYLAMLTLAATSLWLCVCIHNLVPLLMTSISLRLPWGSRTRAPCKCNTLDGWWKCNSCHEHSCTASNTCSDFTSSPDHP